MRASQVLSDGSTRRSFTSHLKGLIPFYVQAQGPPDRGLSTAPRDTVLSA